MNHSSEMTGLSRGQLRELQWARLNALLLEVRKRPFYEERLRNVSLPIATIDDLVDIPLLTKSELVQDARCAPGLVFDLPRTCYTRLHQTSGTKGFPMAVLDTPEDWNWWLRCWDYVLDAAEVTEADVAMMAFSFGPFIGFWTANDALVQRGAMVIPGGGVSSENRIRMIQDHGCTIVCCTPTYALHLAERRGETWCFTCRYHVTRVIVAGEPGGSVASIRDRIEQAWGARSGRSHRRQRSGGMGFWKCRRQRHSCHRDRVHRGVAAF